MVEVVAIIACAIVAIVSSPILKICLRANGKQKSKP